MIVLPTAYGTRASILSPAAGRARADIAVAEMAMSVRIEPKFFMMEYIVGEGQARKSILMKECKR